LRTLKVREHISLDCLRRFELIGLTIVDCGCSIQTAKDNVKETLYCPDCGHIWGVDTVLRKNEPTR
jgi:hypothetical protein